MSTKPFSRSGSRIAVALTALAVAGVGAGAYALQPGSDAVTTARPAAGASASPEASTADRWALDPAAPWALRGDASLLGDGTRETFAREWAARHGGDGSDVVLTPLLVQRYEPSGAVEAVFVARKGSGPWHWGVVASSESGPEFAQDAPLRDGTRALVATLRGDEAERLLVVAAPGAGGAVLGDRPMAAVADGAWTAPVEGGARTWAVVDGDGDLGSPLAEGDVPAYANAG